jgi:hypothetical protein
MMGLILWTGKPTTSPPGARQFWAKWFVEIANCCCLSTVLLFSVGCSAGETISGKVEVNDPFEYQGHPAVKGKVIVFVERTSKTMETNIKEDGTYSIRVPHGPAKIAVQLELKPIPLVGLKGLSKDLIPLQKKAEQWQRIVEDHSSIERTPLKIFVGEDSPIFNITIALPEKK